MPMHRFYIYIYLHRMDLYYLKLMINVMILILNFPYLEIFLIVWGPSHVDDTNNRNEIITAKHFKQGYRYHNLVTVCQKYFGANSTTSYMWT